MDPIDFTPVVRTVIKVVTDIDDAQLTAPTPCTGLNVADLLHHLDGLSLAFTLAATKEKPPGGGRATFDGSRLGVGWRAEIPEALDRLAIAWADPAAYDGMTMAGPIELPAEVAVLVALDEVVVHGWDIARATGQGYEQDEAAVQACLAFAQSFETPPDAGDGPFGPPVPVPADAPALDRLLGATGRDPGWAPPQL
ncbi:MULTISPECIES: TIGR03086 family metal-binding protein [unclassified Nocardioides]|uniref:TIGR03086 family metal-binding protein n=1 Tax=unclassified Nocardioides TaxID=2615069 RepID=UPI0036233FA6